MAADDAAVASPAPARRGARAWASLAVWVLAATQVAQLLIMVVVRTGEIVRADRRLRELEG